MNIKKISMSALIAVIFYSIAVYILTFIYNFTQGLEFVIAILFNIVYFAGAIAVVFFSFSFPEKIFYKVYFIGAIIRIVVSLLFFLVVIKLTGLNALKLIIFIVPLYFVFLLIESLWIHGKALTMEKEKQ